MIGFRRIGIFFEARGNKWSFNASGANAVYANAVGGVIESHRLREANDSEFGCAISKPVADANDSANRREIDDHALFAGDHVAKESFADVEHAADVYGEEAIEIGAGGLEHGADMADAGVVNEHINLALLGVDFGLELSAALFA